MIEREQRPPTASDSVVRRLNSEVVLLLGWGPAILLQLAHPLVAAGVMDHSVFLAHPDQRLRRLHQTIAAMLALTFGTEEAVARTARRINAIHDRVHGQLREAAGPFPAGTPYSAHDPKLLRWVHATMLDTLPRTYELYIGPLTAAEKDRYCAEASQIAPLLGIPDGFLPTSWAALQEYLQTRLASGEITVTPTARELARASLASPVLRLAGPLQWFAQLSTVGLLPPAIRTAYNLPWDARHETALRLSAGMARRILPRLPTVLHHWPAARARNTHAGIGVGRPTR